MLTAEQLNLRAKGIGASEIAAVAGLNPWASPHTVWERKTGRAPPFADTQAMAWGRYMEPAIIAMWKAQTGRRVRYANRHQRTLVHPQHDICLATPDGLVDPDACLEVKTYGFRVAHHWGEPGTDAIPEYYLAQVTWAMAAAGRPRCIVLAANDRQVDEYLVRYEDALFQALLEVAHRFWRDYVFADTPPPADHTARCREFLQRYYPVPLDKECLPVHPDAEAAAARLRDAQQRIAAAKDQESQARNELKQLIGSSYGIHTTLGKVLWYGCKGRSGYDAAGLQQLARQLGATDEQLDALKTTGSGHRVFRAYWKKDEAQ